MQRAEATAGRRDVAATDAVVGLIIVDEHRLSTGVCSARRSSQHPVLIDTTLCSATCTCIHCHRYGITSNVASANIALLNEFRNMKPTHQKSVYRYYYAHIFRHLAQIFVGKISSLLVEMSGY